MKAGRPPIADPSALYALAHQFYWDLKTVSEGLFRIHCDRSLHERLTDQAEATEFTDKQVAHAEKQILQEIEDGVLAESSRGQRLDEVKENLLFDIKFRKVNQASDDSRWTVRVPGEPDVIEQLLSAATPEQVAKICADAFSIRLIQIDPGVVREVQVPNWPIYSSSVLPMYLSQYAAEFIAAKNDPRFPTASRPTNRLKQLWFLSRALAGAVHGIKTRTAINLVGSLRPEQMFLRSRDGRSKRKVAHRTRILKSPPRD